MKNELSIGFIGNPNCGKTTLFNNYTGAKLKVANWPGVTVEKKEGAFRFHGDLFKLVDLPGLYSLTCYTMEEKVSREYILSDDLDVIVDVVDASSLERNLYLTLQLIELQKPVVMALNMMDIVEERGMEIDLHRLPEMLGIPVIPVSATRKRGMDILMHAISHHQDGKLDVLEHQHSSESNHKHDHHQEYTMVYSDFIEDKIDHIIEILEKEYPDMKNYRWHAIKFLERDEDIVSRYPVDLSSVIDRSYEKDIINQKYEFIDEIIQEVLVNKAQKEALTDKVDQLLTHRYLGIPIFLGIMALVFFLTFTIGDGIKEYFEMGLDFISSGAYSLLENMGASEILISLIVDGIIAGVGGILSFLPNIFILFLALALLEDSGYMARVAYVMDGIMSSFGLSGKAFIPMLLGFGCTVPAIMASRSLEDPRDRLKTILITPFMSCSARLPIYVLFSELFFKEKAMIAAYSMYVLGILVAMMTAFVVHLLEKKHEQHAHTLLIELPEYKKPNARTISIYVYEKVEDYVTKAGTTIFLASIVIWFLLNFGPTGLVSDMSLSFGAMIGKLLEPIFKPLGLGYWQMIVALISGIAAKEVVVSSTSILFGINNITSQSGMNAMLVALGNIGFTSLNAYAFMAFCLLYIPCGATIATIKRESHSWKWTVFEIAFQLIVAWVVAFLIYQLGSLI